LILLVFSENDDGLNGSIDLGDNVDNNWLNVIVGASVLGDSSYKME
jgi:hypothetical protein